MSSSFRVSSDRTIPVTVWVEPWGEDFTILPGEEYLFTAVRPGSDFYFHAVWQENDLVLYAEGTSGEVTVHHGTVEVFCGHNREKRHDRAF